MKVRQYKDILLECLVTLRHARTFVTSREKMHQTGIELYDNLIVEIGDALEAPEPSLPATDDEFEQGYRSDGQDRRLSDEKPVSQCQLDGCTETRTIGGRHCIEHEAAHETSGEPQRCRWCTGFVRRSLMGGFICDACGRAQ